MPLVKNFPSKIFFFCSQPSPEGGETSIIPSHVIVEKMEEKVPEFVGKVSKLGVTFPAKLPKEDQPGDIISRSWKWLLNTDDQEEAERRALERFRISSTKFNQDGSMEYVFGPWSPIEEFEGRRVWFIPLPDYSKDTDDKQMHYRFGDGSAFPIEALDAYKQIVNDNNVDLKWQKGDILLVDNLCAQHARRPGKQPRVVLVSLCK
ncbi:PREDICTED: clavaminate synthase-like protein At3g21360 [Nelumbo nucifera]|uniref:Clavaminate synthase-like protein At3g21360 n=1 Tax=Nelumbo nucifera TaxID=4432 RepID=A0A1U7YRP6_NELNU|nr:PREDICTED: clavaminate synthase-like protein At3g21360 [Nelumbo nucifera]